MKKGVLLMGLVILFFGFVLAAPSWKTNSCPIKNNTNVVFYGETGFGGVGDLSKSWVVHFLDWWKQQDSSINYVSLDSSSIKSSCNLTSFPNLKIYIQPGGDAYYQQRTLASAGKDALVNYINNGKGFVGICAGFYYTASDYWWQDQFYSHPYLLGLYPTVEGSIREIADYDQSPDFALTPLSNGFNAIYYGGPTRGYEFTPNETPGQINSTFVSYGNNLPAIITYNNMLLSSVHLEAYENDGVSGLSTEQRVENYKYLANLINDVSGTNFYVPAYINGSAPVNETNQTIFFFDGFENGIVGWNTVAVSDGNKWTSATTNSYSGVSHASSNPMSTTEPASILEKSISTVGYNNIRLSYYRKLVGLDAADEFKAKWFDGNSWQTLEQTGRNSANDANYLLKEFSLLESAGNNSNLKIRFECTAGAVSESCHIDDVKIEAQ